MESKFLFFFVISSFPFLSSFTQAYDFPLPPLAKGLSWTFYSSSCPNLEIIVRNRLFNAFKTDIGLAAGLVRIHFHDCFVQGCEGSVLLDGTPSAPGEQKALPNQTLRPRAIQLIEEIRSEVERSCGRVVSCSDIATLAARDSVLLKKKIESNIFHPDNQSGGLYYPVPLGRRDGLTYATEQTVLNNLPSPFSNVTTLITSFASKNLDVTDLVALSGAHTFGIGHCPAFTPRLYPTTDPTMDESFASRLRVTCPKTDSPNSTPLDVRTPDAFDNKYYVNLKNRQGLFTSDQGLQNDARTRGIVNQFATDQMAFFERFVVGMVKMGQLGVLTGNQGEIRRRCGVRNSVGGSLGSVVREDVKVSAV
ncbi:Peroxidase 12 [Acorus gramineus]|uniref:Peroxidase n=1 Tax=Acorus gramineus TaxID=55184 RepID=A0AAV9AKC3_ACOGR|nr:Peroxidase 12 [Acorus gramineus]